MKELKYCEHKRGEHQLEMLATPLSDNKDDKPLSTSCTCLIVVCGSPLSRLVLAGRLVLAFIYSIPCEVSNSCLDVRPSALHCR